MAAIVASSAFGNQRKHEQDERDRLQKLSHACVVSAINLTPEVRVVPFTYRWNVHRFTGFCTGDMGERISSPPFSSGLLGPDEKWGMCIYPNGCRTDKSDCVALFVFLVSSSEEFPSVKATMRLAVVSEDGKEHQRPAKSQLCEFVPGRAGAGFPDFIRRDQIEEYLRDDVLTVVCRLKIFIKRCSVSE